MGAESSIIINPALFYPSGVSALVSGLLVFTQHLHGKYSLDHHEGVQKFHDMPTPRIGGIALMIALVSGYVLAGQYTGGLLGLMIFAGLPAFFAGLLEDITRKVGVRERLLATICSGGFACLIMATHLDHVDVPGLDELLRSVPVAILFTAIAVGGVANSINIIDGFNGLAGGVLMICFFMLGLIALEVGDHELMYLCLILFVAVLGFMVFNFPYGKIFMGDGGAYLMGFMLAWTAVLLPMRNPEVSPWASIVVCGYAITETLYSMVRRTITRTGSGNPDAAHLHSLIKVNVVRRFFSGLPQSLRNALVSPFCWLISIVFALPAVWLYSSTVALMLVFIGSFIMYIVLYTVISKLSRFSRN